jgi:hypothetical protein
MFDIRIESGHREIVRAGYQGHSINKDDFRVHGRSGGRPEDAPTMCLQDVAGVGVYCLIETVRRVPVDDDQSAVRMLVRA